MGRPKDEEPGDASRGKLTDRDVAFCEGILAGKSPWRAYFDVPGHHVKPATARAQAITKAKTPEVQAYLAARRLELAETTSVTPERVINEMAKMAFMDPAEIVAMEIKKPADIAHLPEHVRKCIVGFKWDRNDRLVLQLADKQAALDKLAKHLGLYQADAKNYNETPGALLATIQWRFVIALHVHKGTSISESLAYAQRNPAEVEAWAEAAGLTGGGAGKALLPPIDEEPEEQIQDAVVIEGDEI